MIELIARAGPLLLQGTIATIGIGLVAYALALPFGLCLAIVRLYGPRWLSFNSRVFVSFFCGTPLLVQILLLYYGMPSIGIVLPAVPTVIVALMMHSGAYMSEDCRGAINSVSVAQWDAARAVGLGFGLILLLVVVPQALRNAVPTLGSRFIAMMKETSLASVVTVVELTRVAESVGSATFRYLEMFVIVAGIYWMISVMLERGQLLVEKRLARSSR